MRALRTPSSTGIPPRPGVYRAAGVASGVDNPRRGRRRRGKPLDEDEFSLVAGGGRQSAPRFSRPANSRAVPSRPVPVNSHTGVAFARARDSSRRQDPVSACTRLRIPDYALHRPSANRSIFYRLN